MGLLPNYALLNMRYFNPIVITDNERCSILVRLVSVDFYVVHMYIFLAVCLTNGFYSDGVGRLLKLPLKLGIYAIWFPLIYFFAHNCFKFPPLFFSIFFPHFIQKFRSHFIDTLICLIYIVGIYLVIFITVVFFHLKNYNIPIEGNVRNIFEIWSALFWIRFTSFWFPMTTINIIVHASVCGMYLLYLIIEYLHNILHSTDIFLMCCSRTFIHLM